MPREHAHAAETASPESHASEELSRLPVADLVGWATEERLQGDLPLSTELSRDVLATALGVRPDGLDRFSDAEVGGALLRLRALVIQIQKLAAEVTVDELTGAMRRGAGVQALEREVARFRRVGGKGVALAFIDVDGLKRINDTEGHPAGDALLTEVVAAIRERLRAYDLVIRWGGDEFVCVLSNATADDAEHTVADIEANVRSRTKGGSVSTGLAALEATDTVDSLVARADARLYARRQAVRT